MSMSMLGRFHRFLGVQCTCTFVKKTTTDVFSSFYLLFKKLHRELRRGAPA